MITLSKASDISFDRIASLVEPFRARVKTWYENVLNSGVYPYIYEGLRSDARQTELYCFGRTLPGRIVTNAMAGQSFHNYGLAFDWVSLRLVDKADRMYECDWDNEGAYLIGRKCAEPLKLRFLSWETPHLEDGTYESWREVKKIFRNE